MYNNYFTYIYIYMYIYMLTILLYMIYIYYFSTSYFYFQDQAMVGSFVAYPEVVLMDATYKLNNKDISVCLGCDWS